MPALELAIEMAEAKPTDIVVSTIASSIKVKPRCAEDLRIIEVIISYPVLTGKGG
jgi:hypothetical protein